MTTDRAKAGAFVSVTRGKGVSEGVRAKGVWEIELRDKDGNLKHHSVETNMVTVEGLRYLLDAALDNSAGGYTEQTAWYIALVSTDTAESTAYVYDTFLDGATVPASEFTSYGEATRVLWDGEIHATDAQIDNLDSKAEFSINASGTVYGAALVSLNTKSDHTAGDYLYSYTKFASGVSVVNTDTLTVSITLTLADS